MGTVMRVTLPTEETPALRAAVQACFARFEQVDQTMSEWKPGSPVAELNRQAGRAPVKVPEELWGLLETAQRISAASNGAFDVTWAALWGLWQFTDASRPPSRDDVASRLQHVGWKRLRLDAKARTAYLPERGMAVGLGAIAKGHALAMAALELRSRGIQDFLLDAGGQVYGGGMKGPGQPWKVGIREPRGGPEDSFAGLALTDASISTSGDYERFFVAEGVRFHHIIDTRTGSPARGARSATVVASDPTLADACSTAAFVLGAPGGLEFARKMGVDLLLVDANNRVHMTPGMKARLLWSHPPRDGSPRDGSP